MVNITMQEAAVGFPSSLIDFFIYIKKLFLLVYSQTPNDPFCCRLDINEITVDATTTTGEASFYADSCPAPALPSEVSHLITLSFS
jgi:hypothetical protein